MKIGPDGNIFRHVIDGKMEVVVSDIGELKIRTRGAVGIKVPRR